MDAIASSDPALPDVIAERLDQDPTAAAIDRMTEHFRWQMLALVGLAMVLNTALMGIGVVGRYGSTEIEVTPSVPVMIEDVVEPLPAPLKRHLW